MLLKKEIHGHFLWTPPPLKGNHPNIEHYIDNKYTKYRNVQETFDTVGYVSLCNGKECKFSVSLLILVCI